MKSIAMRAGLGLILVLGASSALAQMKQFEISAGIGYTLSDGVRISPIDVEGVTYDRIDPESGFSYGFDFGFFMDDFNQIGFLMSQQQSKLVAKGGLDRQFVDLSLNNYLGYYAFNAGYEDDPARPFFLIGVGAAHYITGRFEGREIDNRARFTFTLGGGAKVYPSESIGLKLMGRWTPTYIKTDPGGWWCDPFWGCYTVGNTQYSHQFEFSANLIYRF